MPQEFTATITDVGQINQWDGPNGTVYYHEITLDNSDWGTIGKKTSGAVKVGDRITYTIEPSSNGNKIKQVFQPQGSGGNFASAAINEPLRHNVNNPQSASRTASFAAAYSKDLVIRGMELRAIAHPEDPVSFNAWVDAMLVTATKINNWMQEQED